MIEACDSVLADAGRIAMWQALHAAAARGIGTVHHWTLDDGLPHPAPGAAHQHTMPTVLMALSGTIAICGRDRLALEPGELLIIDPGCWHAHETPAVGATSCSVGFLADLCDVVFSDATQVLWGAVPRNPYRSMIDALGRADEGGTAIARANELLRQLIRDQVHYVDWINPGVLTMAAYLWNHLHERIDAQDIIDHGGLGRSRSYTLFKAFFKQSPKQELLMQRLDLAQHLLRAGYRIGEIADRCGFASRADLTRAYRRRFGVPPRSARRLATAGV